MSEKNVTKNEENESEKLWNEIKNISLNMFGNLNQTIESCTQRYKINSKDVHLKLKFSAVIIGLEEVLSKDRYGNSYNPPRYKISIEEPFVIITQAPDSKIDNNK